MSAISFGFDESVGRFRLVVDDSERTMPALQGLALADWHAQYAGVLIRLVTTLDEINAEYAGRTDLRSKIEAVFRPIAAQHDAIEELIDVLVGYDVTTSLGRTWIRRRLSSEQLILILRRIVAFHR
jgi:hypothetical protein